MCGAYAREPNKVPPRKRVYVDGTGGTTGMTRRRGRAAPGRRVADRVPEAGWRVTTLVGAVRLSGPTAALAFDGATDGAASVAFVAEHLCPTLRRGDTVVVDPLGAHRGAEVRRAVEAAGCRLLYLPPYSDDLNPIEDVRSKVKEHLRAAKARARPDLIDAMGDALRSVTPADARGYFRHRDFHPRRTPSRKPL
jgi:transposase